MVGGNEGKMASGRISRNDLSVVPEYLFEKWEGCWGEWIPIMRSAEYPDFERRTSRSGPLTGYKLNSERMRECFFGVDDGIYEWRRIGQRGGRVKVLYVGKTSSDPKDSLFRRIRDYTYYTSHERQNINDVLANRFNLEVRVLSSETTGETPEKMERNALKKYKYPWNDMNQAQ